MSLQAEANSSADRPARDEPASGDWTLLVPGLGRALGACDSRMWPGLARLLARGDRSQSTRYGAHAASARAIFGDSEAMLRWAPAPVLAARECGIEATTMVVRLDPVHLLPAGDHLILQHPGPIRHAEAEALVASIGTALGEDPRILAAVPERWYARLEGVQGATWTAPEAAMGKSIFDALPRGPGAGSLRRLMNEIQMVLHGHPLNEARERAGLPAINSVWPWGWATEVLAEAPRWGGSFYGENAYAAGLAELAGGRVAGADAAPSGEWPDKGLIVCEGPGQALLSGDDRAVDPALQRLDRDWARPLLAALKRGRVRRLRVSSDAWEYQLGMRSAWRFWRRPGGDGGEA